MVSRVYPRETSVSSHVSGASALKSDIREISPLSCLNSSVTFKVRILQEKQRVLRAQVQTCLPPVSVYRQQTEKCLCSGLSACQDRPRDPQVCTRLPLWHRSIQGQRPPLPAHRCTHTGRNLQPGPGPRFRSRRRLPSSSCLDSDTIHQHTSPLPFFWAHTCMEASKYLNMTRVQLAGNTRKVDFG